MCTVLAYEGLVGESSLTFAPIMLMVYVFGNKRNYNLPCAYVMKYL